MYNIYYTYYNVYYSYYQEHMNPTELYIYDVYIILQPR